MIAIFAISQFNLVILDEIPYTNVFSRSGGGYTTLEYVIEVAAVRQK